MIKSEKIKLPFKLLVALCMHPEGLTYKQISEQTGFHLNTVSRYASHLYNKDLVEVKQKKSSNARGRKWVNVVKLKKELLDAKSAAEFFEKAIKQLDGGLNDAFSS
ncbi:MAG: hypothetical protein Q7J54_02455 [Candidatus Woesearchaeota archaeon]|nr:hypothetical protein [Candidatus Woesearchaeota archaeon]